MSGDDILHQRGAALETQFFAAVDAKLMAELQAELKRTDDAKSLAGLSGIDDQAVLDALVQAGVSPSTFPALRLFPLVAVAWADGLLESNERETVLGAADKHSVGMNSPSGGILAAWLAKEPGPDLFAAWEAFAKALVRKLNPSEAQSVRDSILKEVKDVAQASGGLLGWGAISKGESEVVNRVERALTQ